jgi:hypothetical protein
MRQADNHSHRVDCQGADIELTVKEMNRHSDYKNE